MEFDNATRLLTVVVYTSFNNTPCMHDSFAKSMTDWLERRRNNKGRTERDKVAEHTWNVT